MLHDIFKETKKASIKEKRTIIIDIHEKNSLILSELKSNKEIDLKISSLEVGDYIISDIVIERKTINDLVSSLISRRLFEQINNLKQIEKKLLLIEGSPEDITNTKINKNAIKGLILSILTKENIPIIFTKDYLDSADYLNILSKQQSKDHKDLSLHHKTAKTLEEQKQYILSSFPNIGPAKAKQLLDKYKSLNNVFNAREEDLIDILRSQSKDFKNILEK